MATDEGISEGVKYLALKDYGKACDTLSRAVEALATKHGETALEVAEAYMLYGKALLFNSIAQSAILSNENNVLSEGQKKAIPDIAKPDDTPQAEGSTSGKGSGSAPVASDKVIHFEGDDEDEEEEGEEEEEQEEQADSEDDLESAFIFLDLARNIWEKDTTSDHKSSLAEVYRLLGDVATENETFPEAVQEYLTALGILQSYLPPYDRQLSEMHMLIALALDFVPGSTAKAVTHAEKAKEVLLKKIAYLEGVDGPAATKEIEDIKSLMGDLDAKIEDLKVEVPQEAPKTEEEKALEDLLKASTSTNKVQKGLVNNLTVKKKKKEVVKVDDPVASDTKGKGPLREGQIGTEEPDEAVKAESVAVPAAESAADAAEQELKRKAEEDTSEEATKKSKI